MKKIFKYLPLVAAAIMMASCAKEAPSKSSVESGFKKFDVTLPTVTIDSKATCDASNGTATVKVTYTGITSNLDSLSVGVLSDTDPTFRTAYFTKVENPADGTVTVDATVTPNKTYYIRGVVACTAGTSYSDVIEVKVPDVEFWQKVPGVYAGNVQSAADNTKYTNKITIVASSENPETKCYVFGMEAYWESKGYGLDTSKALNCCDATIDSDAKTITIKVGSSLRLGSSTATRYIYGFDSADPETASEEYTNVVLKWGSDDASLVIDNAYATVVVSKETGKAQYEDFYYGGITYKKN